MRPARELTDADYTEFYKHVMGGFVLPGDEPLGHLHLHADAPIQFVALLYIRASRRPTCSRRTARPCSCTPAASS